MTIEEAIKLAEEVVEEQEYLCKRYPNASGYTHWLEYAKKHKQFAEWLKDYKRLKEQEPCEDAISRQAMHIELEKWITYGEYKYSNATKYLYDRIDRLPSVKQEPKTGHWEWVQYDGNPNIGNWHCSECGSIVIECISKEKKGGIPLYKYCPQCGAKIERG